MVERGGAPGRGVVADGAVLREPGRNVVRIGGFLEVCQMAGRACRRQTRVHAAGVALAARHGGVGAGQRELGLVVVECRTLPLSGVVADRAVLGETGRRMIGIGCLLEVGEVARHATAVHQVVVSICVARGALLGGVGAGQRELGQIVVEAGIVPGDCGVAG